MTDKRARGQEVRLTGYPICTGIAIGRPFFFSVPEDNVPEFLVSSDKIDHEVDRYYKALKSSQQDLLFLRTRLQKEGGQEAVSILSSHLEMIYDPLMTTQVEEAIREKGKNTEYAFKSVINEYEKKFSKITDAFFRERLKDFQDISRRIIGHLRKREQCKLSQLTSPAVVFAHELSPSDTAEANTDVIEAFVTRTGAETSHVAIMARAMGIPFVSNVDFPDLSISIPPQVIVDGRFGHVIINPTKQSLNYYLEEQKKLKIEVVGFQKAGVLAAETLDGHKTRLSANVEMIGELDTFLQYGGEGIGLFRSEYLFLARDAFPPEDEQFCVYRNVVEKVAGYRSVIRTFDIGGDKLGNFHMTRYEKNPYLGCRAVRLMRREYEVFKTQMKAILRASAFGEVGILFPMISGITELRECKVVLEEAKAELLRKGIPFSRSIPIGCMVEVPSAAITCDILAKECDFLSIGTNDLVQYVLAADRDNAAVRYLYTPTHPSILRLIKMVVEEGNRFNIPVSICGEIAADPRFTPLLIGLGLQELSIAPPALPTIKERIRSLKLIDAQNVAIEALACATPIEVEELLEREHKKFRLSKEKDKKKPVRYN